MRFPSGFPVRELPGTLPFGVPTFLDGLRHRDCPIGKSGVYRCWVTITTEPMVVYVVPRTLNRRSSSHGPGTIGVGTALAVNSLTPLRRVGYVPSSVTIVTRSSGRTRRHVRMALRAVKARTRILGRGSRNDVRRG